jgi:hypothetical protein
MVKDDKGVLVADFQSILTKWRNHFSQLLNVLGANNVRQTEIHTAEPPVPELCVFEVEVAIELNRRKWQGVDKILAELIKVGGKTIHSENHKLIN